MLSQREASEDSPRLSVANESTRRAIVAWYPVQAGREGCSTFAQSGQEQSLAPRVEVVFLLRTITGRGWRIA